ncbi:ImmA/IrrE family metallo-endopeptidase [Clostridium sp.]|uniref:ImmA/IrrE family metallo-endopeptidase n=1 Tax=Clostridium sp. TaxID=1506 RepID=UPI00262810F2|nr:ImmA/IrrE family metallo-endopeptidase [Clostridium sp.]
MSYENLLIEAEEKGIRVKEKNMYINLKGAYKNNKILINLKVTTNVEKKCILSEEIGHHETSYGNILDDNKIVNRKQEIKARRWGYEHTIKIEDLIRAHEYGAVNSFEIAEYLNVTEQHLINTIKNYKKRYGVLAESENHFIYFEPYLKVEKKDTFSDYLLNL